jgi:hypothetical protein
MPTSQHARHDMPGSTTATKTPFLSASVFLMLHAACASAAGDPQQRQPLRPQPGLLVNAREAPAGLVMRLLLLQEQQQLVLACVYCKAAGATAVGSGSTRGVVAATRRTVQQLARSSRVLLCAQVPVQRSSWGCYAAAEAQSVLSARKAIKLCRQQLGGAMLRCAV